MKSYVEWLARWTAAIGGMLLVAIAVMSAISIFGRTFLWAGLRPIPGDFELVEAGTAAVVAAFMPWCQFNKGHASVNVVTSFFSDRVNLIIDLLADLLLFAVAVFVTWRHYHGLLDKKAYGEVTFILQFPLWWAYAATLVGLVVWIVVGAWCVWDSGRAVMGRSNSAREGGPVHD